MDHKHSGNKQALRTRSVRQSQPAKRLRPEKISLIQIFRTAGKRRRHNVPVSFALDCRAIQRTQSHHTA